MVDSSATKGNGLNDTAENIPRGGYSHILTIRVCAAVQGMVFKPFCREQGIENTYFRSGKGCQILARLE